MCCLYNWFSLFRTYISLIHCKLGLPSTMQRVQSLMYFLCNNYNVITVVEYFIIDCHQSLSIAVGRNYSWVHNVEITFTKSILMHFKYSIYQNGSFIWLQKLLCPLFPSISHCLWCQADFMQHFFFSTLCEKCNLNIEYFSTLWWKWIRWLYECQQKCLRETCEREMWEWPVLPFSSFSFLLQPWD